MPFHPMPMSMTYDGATAVKELNDLSEERIRNTANKLTSGNVQLANVDLSDVTVLGNGHPTKWNLICATAKDDTVEEMVLSFQGILRWRDLPPVKGSRDRLQTRLMTLRQQVHIIGYNDHTFLRCLDKVQDIYELFSRAVPHDLLMHWAPETYPEGIAISAGNRYFTLRQHADMEAIISLDDTTDPGGILRDLQHDGILYTEDNEVKYYACSEEDGVKRHHGCMPSSFKVGDIVEAQLSFLAVPTKDGPVKMITKLRALTLLSSIHTRAANFRELAAASIIGRPAKRMRRHTGYDDNEDAEPFTNIAKTSAAQSDVHMTKPL